MRASNSPQSLRTSTLSPGYQRDFGGRYTTPHNAPETQAIKPKPPRDTLSKLLQRTSCSYPTACSQANCLHSDSWPLQPGLLLPETCAGCSPDPHRHIQPTAVTAVCILTSALPFTHLSSFAFAAPTPLPSSLLFFPGLSCLPSLPSAFSFSIKTSLKFWILAPKNASLSLGNLIHLPTINGHLFREEDAGSMLTPGLSNTRACTPNRP